MRYQRDSCDSETSRSSRSRSIERFVENEIKRIVIVTGHLASFYEELADKHNGLIHTVHNDRFPQSGSFFSLSLALEEVDSPFLLLESDLIYEARAVSGAFEHPPIT